MLKQDGEDTSRKGIVHKDGDGDFDISTRIHSASMEDKRIQLRGHHRESENKFSRQEVITLGM